MRAGTIGAECDHCGGLLPERSATGKRTRDDKRFCSERCRNNFYYTHVVKARALARMDRHCPVCGEAIPPERVINAKYCSPKCANSYKNTARWPRWKQTCPHCGEAFQPKRKPVTYCSPRCAGKANYLAGRICPPWQKG